MLTFSQSDNEFNVSANQASDVIPSMVPDSSANEPPKCLFSSTIKIFLLDEIISFAALSPAGPAPMIKTSVNIFDFS